MAGAAGSTFGNSIAFPSAPCGAATGDEAGAAGSTLGSSIPLVSSGVSNLRLGLVGGTFRSPGIFGGKAGDGLSLPNHV